MKYLALVSLLCFTSCLTNKPTVSVMGGSRNFNNSGNWEEMDHQVSYGVQADYASEDSIGPEFAFIYSEDQRGEGVYVNRGISDADTKVYELYAGARKNAKFNKYVNFYFGGGLALLKADTDVDLNYTDSANTDRTTMITPYIHGGVELYPTNNHFFLNLDYRYTFLGEDGDIFVTSPDSSGGLIMIGVGYNF